MAASQQRDMQGGDITKSGLWVPPPPPAIPFVQLVATHEDLFAMDRAGDVWVLGEEGWYKQPMKRIVP